MCQGSDKVGFWVKIMKIKKTNNLNMPPYQQKIKGNPNLPQQDKRSNNLVLAHNNTQFNKKL
jgi:hypothetical protein